MTDLFCGQVALIGRPNVGKSTLINRLVGQKVAITSHKAQTTRHRIRAVLTKNQYQAIFIDTPGLHRTAARTLNRYMNRAAKSVLDDVDLILFISQAGQWTPEDQWVLDQTQRINCPIFWVINKTDHLKNQDAVLPQIHQITQTVSFSEIIAISARKGDQIDLLESLIFRYLPHRPHQLVTGDVSVRTPEFYASEIIRAQMLFHLHQEVPYTSYVRIETYDTQHNRTHIAATLVVETRSQKGIVIGKNGQMIKAIGQAARLELVKHLNHPVTLKLWVRVEENWPDQPETIGAQNL